jgi:hypothetical protein
MHWSSNNIDHNITTTLDHQSWAVIIMINKTNMVNKKKMHYHQNRCHHQDSQSSLMNMNQQRQHGVYQHANGYLCHFHFNWSMHSVCIATICPSMMTSYIIYHNIVVVFVCIVDETVIIIVNPTK